MTDPAIDASVLCIEFSKIGVVKIVSRNELIDNFFFVFFRFFTAEIDASFGDRARSCQKPLESFLV